MRHVDDISALVETLHKSNKFHALVIQSPPGWAKSSHIQLQSGTHPLTTLPGVVVSSLSLSFMFLLWRSKRTLARLLESATVMKDADCSLACIKLSVVLFAGSFLFFMAPSLWWADAAAALVLAFIIGREGWETIKAARKATFSGGCGCSHSKA